jgi:hypothetical protein
MNRRNLFCLLLVAGVSASLDAGAIPKEVQRATCQRRKQQLDALRLKMRMGYTARQGRILRQKISAVEQELKAGRC